MNCKIVSPKKTLFSGPVESITLPSQNGEVQILPGHAESFFLLRKGEIVLKTKERKKTISVSEGIFYVASNEAVSIVLNEEAKI